jgi:aryl-alcohol dehydrogenase-like predicted oxidoreductase
MHPQFLIDQVERSLERLGLASLDVFLLHNPEYALKKFELEGLDPLQSRALFEDRLARAFACLESLVAEGKIKSYGLSSNTLGMPSEDPAHVNLRRCAELAGPNFRVAQLPLNWIEIAPTVFPVESHPSADVSRGTGRNTLQYAKEVGIGILVNRPFNAMHDNGLIRLTRPHVPTGAMLDDQSRRGLANWTQLAHDLEALAKRHIDRCRVGFGGRSQNPLRYRC